MKKQQRKVIPWIWVLLPVYCVISLFVPAIGIIALLCMVAPVITAIYRGRRWCGAFCPRGNFNDVILPGISFHRGIPALLRQKWFRLTFLVLLMSAFTIQIFLAWGDLGNVGMVFVRMIVMTTLLAMILGISYQPRTWCTICPMGTMAGLVSKVTQAKRKHPLVTFDKKNCIDCGMCSRNCIIGIDVHHYKEEGRVIHPDCLKCNACIEGCPKKAIKIV